MRRAALVAALAAAVTGCGHASSCRVRPATASEAQAIRTAIRRSPDTAAVKRLRVTDIRVSTRDGTFSAATVQGIQPLTERTSVVLARRPGWRLIALGTDLSGWVVKQPAAVKELLEAPRAPRGC